MLLSFRFANHRSFRYEQQLNLTPVYASDVPEEEASSRAVRVAGIFGANAAGKSNALHALWFMRRFAIRSDREVEPGISGVARHPFRLDEAAVTEPSRYVVDLSIDGVRHTYGFAIDDERVLEEWLYYYPVKKRRVFERQGVKFKWGEESGKRDELESIADITAPTALFLSTVARFDQRRPSVGPQPPDPLHSVYRWFFRVRSHVRGAKRTPLLWPDAEKDRAVIVSLVQAADVGITDIQLKTAVPEALFSEETEAQLARADAATQRRMRDMLRQQMRDRQRLMFSHRGPAGDVMLNLSDESSGTQQLLDLAIDAAAVLRLKATMTVDEIDASLHPMLTARLIGLFQSHRTNPLGSQLLFTSHDATLLGNFDSEEVLRRDQIWFTEKDNEGMSTIYPLSDFKPRREGENRQRRYLNGNYGGVPDLSADVFEQALFARGEFDAEPAT